MSENKNEKKDNKEVADLNLEYANKFMELSSSLAGFMSQGNSGAVTDVKISDIQKYLQNPYENIKDIRNTSVYLTNKHGILRDANRMVKSLPTLKYSLSWSVDEDEDIGEHEDEANEFLSLIEVVDTVRDGLLEVAELGTVVMCLRSKKYVQFLNLDDIEINKQRDGKWVVEYDLESLDNIRDEKERKAKIDSLPDEVTMSKYNSYKNARDNKEEKQFVEISNCEVVNLDAKRNSPYGLPMTLGAWLPILQKEVIDQVERSVSDRMVKQILVLSAGHMDKDKTKPAPPELIDFYFKKIENLVREKDNKNYGQGGGDSSGTGVVAFPDLFSLDSLEVDTTLFTDDLYEKIENDIYANLGISKSLAYGEGGNYSSSEANTEKIFSVIFSLVGQFETAINNFLRTIFPDGVVCTLSFDKTTIMDKQSEIENKFTVYQQTGVIKPWLEAVLDMPLEDVVKQKKYENELGLEELFYPPLNAHTSSGKDRDLNKPEHDEPDEPNDNTARSKSNNGNSNPSPSDYGGD